MAHLSEKQCKQIPYYKGKTQLNREEKIMKSYERKAETGFGIGGAIAGGIAGFKFGASIGIATGGTAIAGTIPCTVIGLMLGGLGLGKIGNEIDRH